MESHAPLGEGFSGDLGLDDALGEWAEGFFAAGEEDEGVAGAGERGAFREDEVADGDEHALVDMCTVSGGGVGGFAGGGLAEHFDEGGARKNAVAEEGMIGREGARGENGAVFHAGVIEPVHAAAMGNLWGEVVGGRIGHAAAVSMESESGRETLS